MKGGRIVDKSCTTSTILNKAVTYLEAEVPATVGPGLFEGEASESCKYKPECLG